MMTMTRKEKKQLLAFGVVLVIVIVVVVLYRNSKKKKNNNNKENFVNVPLTWKIDQVSSDGCGGPKSVHGNYQNTLYAAGEENALRSGRSVVHQYASSGPASHKKPSPFKCLAANDGNSKMYTVPSNWQSDLSPRAANADYGAFIKYNMPSKEHQGVPTDPLSYGNMVKDNYSHCGGDNYGTPLEGSEAIHGAMHANYAHDTTDMLPVNDMCAGSMGAPNQPIIYNRFIYANQKSRLNGAGDRIRGDLPIVPELPNSDPNSQVWFRPSVHPHIDLTQGALTAMAGRNNDTSKNLENLMQASSSGTLQSFAGAAAPQHNLNSVNNKYLSTTAAGGDIQVTSFP